MSVSALLLFVTGLALSFVSAEIIEATVGQVDQVDVVLGQLLGAAYLAFAFVNWMNRGATLGGIYGRPLTMPNFMHFAIVAITLGKLASAVPDPGLFAAAAASTILAAWFGAVVFNPPPMNDG